MGFFLAEAFGRVKRLSWNDLLDEIGARSTPPFASKPDWKQTREQDETVQQTIDGLYAAFSNGNKIAESIARAVTWYSKAMSFTEPSEQFVALAIALDSLLGRQGVNTDISRASALSITQTISERVAFLLETDYEARVARYGATARLYGLRSKIVHEGQPVTAEDVFELEELLKDVVLVFFARDFSSWKEVQAWTRREVFTTGESQTVNEEAE